MERIVSSFERLKDKIEKYQGKCDFALLDKAYALASEAHQGQSRYSGEPYFLHPLEVAHILADMELDMESIVAAILHDTVEDTHYTYEDIQAQFGEQIALLVEGVTKLEKIPYSSKEEQQIENLRKMFLAMAKDIRVVLIKLADRLHNLRTLKSMPVEHQLQKAHETMEVYAPLAHRLGMSKLKWEMEDLSLRYLDPIAYQEISEHIHQRRAEREAYLKKVQGTLEAKLEEMGIKAHLEGRAKHFYSIYRKMYTNNIDIDQIYDLLAVRVIVDTMAECYAVLGLVHELYKPIPGRFKDYIATPKKNMYQSLHTSLIGPGGRPFEIQIRTWEMHQIAEVGIAAHWKYKEGVDRFNDLDSKFEWVRQLLEVHTNDNEDFMRSLKIDLFEDEVFVFSPKGDLINLPAGSLSIDFAYCIHSAIGNKMTGARINGRMMPLDYKLQNGDIVEIITSTVPHGPSRDWAKMVKTSQARKKINDWFKKEDRDNNIARGKEMLEREMKRNMIPLTILNNKELMAATFKRYTLTSWDDLYAMIGFGGLASAKAITKIKEFYRKQEGEATPPIGEHIAPQKVLRSSSNGIVVKGIENCLVRLARCCNPVPGDDIVGYITRGRGVSVHRGDCVNARNLQEDESQEGRFLEVRWADVSKASYIADIQIIANDRENLILDTINVVSALKMQMSAVNGRPLKNGLSVVNMTLEIASKEQLELAMKNFWKIQGVTSVVRTKQ